MITPEQVIELALRWLPAIIIVGWVASYAVNMLRDMFRHDD